MPDSAKGRVSAAQQAVKVRLDELSTVHQEQELTFRTLLETHHLMHHGEAIVIQGDSYRMKDKGSDEQPT
jgi:hypothetical protein